MKTSLNDGQRDKKKKDHILFYLYPYVWQQKKKKNR